MRSRLVILCALLFSGLFVAPAHAGSAASTSDPDTAIVGATYGRGVAGPGSYAVLIDVDEISVDRGKPAAKPNCSPDDPAAPSGGYVYTGWKIQTVLPFRLNAATVPSQLGNVTPALQSSLNAWRVDAAVPQLTITTGSTVTKQTANRIGDVLFGRTGSSLATTYTWQWNDVDTIMEFFSEDCEFDTPRGPTPFGRPLRGKEEVRGGIAARFIGIPDVHYGDDAHWHCGDRGVSEWTLSGRTTEGQRIEVRGCDLFVFSGDKIRRKDSFWKIVE